MPHEDLIQVLTEPFKRAAERCKRHVFDVRAGTGISIFVEVRSWALLRRRGRLTHTSEAKPLADIASGSAGSIVGIGNGIRCPGRRLFFLYHTRDTQGCVTVGLRSCKESFLPPPGHSPAGPTTQSGSARRLSQMR